MFNKTRHHSRLSSLLLISGVLALHLSASAQSPSSPAHIQRAFYREDYTAVISLAKSYLQEHPRDTIVRVFSARAKMAIGDQAAAYAELHQALKIAPDDMDVLYHLGELCTALSQAHHQELYALAPNSARVHQILGDSFRIQDMPDKAQQEYESALQSNPQLVEVLVSLADLLRYKFRFDEAVGYYSRALAVQPKNYDAAYGLGASHLYRQEVPKAIEYFRLALSVQPKSAPCLLALGDALLKAGQNEAAASELKAAIKLEPEMHQAYTLLGRAYQRLGRSEEAKTAFAKVQELIRLQMQSRERLISQDDLIPVESEASPQQETKP